MEFPIEKMYKVFKVSKAAYYKCRRWLGSERGNENRMLISKIRRVHENSETTYGSPRITEELKANGFKYPDLG